jgi:hypothetical protein
MCIDEIMAMGKYFGKHSVNNFLYITMQEEKTDRAEKAL